MKTFLYHKLGYLLDWIEASEAKEKVLPYFLTVDAFLHCMRPAFSAYYLDAVAQQWDRFLDLYVAGHIRTVYQQYQNVNSRKGHHSNPNQGSLKEDPSHSGAS